MENSPKQIMGNMFDLMIGILWRFHQHIGMMDGHVEGILAANQPE